MKNKLPKMAAIAHLSLSCLKNKGQELLTHVLLTCKIAEDLIKIEGYQSHNIMP